MRTEQDPAAAFEQQEANERMVREGFWPKLRRTACRVPFAEDLVAVYYCAIDPQTPARAKAVLLSALAYFILPADLMPDFIVALGFTDDATVLMTAIGMVQSHLKPRHREKARAALAREPAMKAAQPAG